MAKLVWDETEKRLYETGVDHVALFLMNSKSEDPSHPYSKPVAWNGITGITESPDGADANDIYADNIKYLSLISKENWKGTIKAYTSPKQFKVCEGEIEFNSGNTSADVNNIYFGQQSRRRFALAWRTIVGNASEGDGYGYKLHIAYGLSAAPSERDHATENDSPEATEFSWEINSIPEVATHEIADGIVPEPVSHVVIDSKKSDGTDNDVYTAIEAKVFDADQYLMGIDDLIDEIKTAAA